MKRGGFGWPKNRNQPQNEYVPQGAAGRIVAGKSWFALRRLLSGTGSLGRGGLVLHVHDLDAAVGFRHRLVRVLELAFAVADRDQVGAVDAVFIDQITFDGI